MGPTGHPLCPEFLRACTMTQGPYVAQQGLSGGVGPLPTVRQFDVSNVHSCGPEAQLK